MAAVVLGLIGTMPSAAPQVLPLYTAYQDAPLDAGSAGNLTAKLARWLSQRSAGRYRFEPVQMPRGRLDAHVATPGWQGAVVWANPYWFGDTEQRRFLWTGPFMHDADLLVSNKRRPVEYLREGLSLEGLTLGAVTGHRLRDLDRLVAVGKIKRLDSARVLDGLRLLQQGRVDAVLVQAISMDAFRRELPGLDGWLHIASQPRETYTRHAFTAPGNEALRDFLAAQLQALETDPEWHDVLPRPPRQLRLVSVDPLASAYNQALRQLLDRVFERAGLRYALTERPAERAVAELRAGQFDGDLTRHQRFGELLPGLLRVEPSHSTAFELAITRQGGPQPASFEELAGLRVAVPRGYKRVEELTRGLALRELVEGVDACVRMVVQRRVDVCVQPGYSATVGLGRVPEGASLETRVLSASDMHLWLAAGHDEEARRLGQVLAQMERSGELEQLMGAFRRRP